VIEEAGRAFRRSGMSVGVDTVMAEAELTHGSFYRYFDSKEALLEEAMSRAIDGFEALLLAELGSRADSDDDHVAEIARRYLSRLHRDNPEQGCPLPPLLADVARMSDDRRLAIGRRIEQFVDRVCAASGSASRERVVAALATCVGGVLVARACRGQPLSDEVLLASRALVTASRNMNDSKNHQRKSKQ